MNAAVESPRIRSRSRGDGLLLHHVLVADRSQRPREPARTRLDRALGAELARLLVTALAAQGRRGSSSP